MTAREKRNETLRKRYHVYRRLGYDAKTSRALSQRALDVSELEISKRTGVLKRNKRTREFINVTMRDWKAEKAIDRYVQKVSRIRNDTVLTKFGMIVHDPRYKGETGRVISILKNRHNLTTDQAYYFYYMIQTQGLTYERAKKELLTSKDFEIYIPKNRRRAMSPKEYRRAIVEMKKRRIRY